MTRIKICGLKSASDANMVASLGADAVGLVFAPSKRRISPTEAKAITANLPPMVTVVGVFVNEDAATVNRIVSTVGLNAVQLHGDESPDYCEKIECTLIKAIRVKEGYLDEINLYKGKVQGFLLDTYLPGKEGGTGVAFDWNKALPAKDMGPLILAGGLTPENVHSALRLVRPYAVDVSTGVETDGVKDFARIKKFIEEVRRYDDASIAR